MVEEIDAIILRLDASGRVTYFNKFARKLFGFQEKEVLGKPITDTIVPKKGTSGENLRKMVAEVFRNPKKYLSNENENVTKKGKKVWVSWQNTPVFGKNKKLEGFLCVGNDITERKKIRTNIAKVNRALKMISECNRALIHAEKETELLNNICKIIVESGGYRMAWVGEAQHDENKSVRPLAQKGFEKGYLKNAGVSWSEKTVKGNGPTGIAIRTERITIGSDFIKDPNLLPWRERAIKRGYRSSIALPLKFEKRVFGALMIYSREPNAFNKEEINLLKGLADDLAFGVNVLRSRQARQRTEAQLIESYKHLGTINRKISLLLDLGYQGKKRNKKDIASYVLNSAINLSRASTGAIYRLGEDGRFRLLCSNGDYPYNKNNSERISQSSCGILKNLLQKKVSLRGHPQKHSLGVLIRDKNLTYFLALPLMRNKKTSGFIFLGFNDRVSMDSHELEFYDVFSVHASSALINARILE